MEKLPLNVPGSTISRHTSQPSSSLIVMLGIFSFTSRQSGRNGMIFGMVTVGAFALNLGMLGC